MVSPRRGWVPYPRAFKDTDLCHDTHAAVVLLHVLFNTWSEKTTVQRRGRTVEVEPFTAVLSSRQLADQCGLPRSTVRRALKRLEMRHVIGPVLDPESGPQFMVIKVLGLEDFEEQRTRERTEKRSGLRLENGPKCDQKRPENFPDALSANGSAAPNNKEEQQKENTPQPPKGAGPADLAEVWNANCDPLPRVKLPLNGTRERKARARLVDQPDLERWAECVRVLAAWPWGRGENDRGWRANFDYMIRPDTLDKAQEGAFGRPSEGNGAAEQERRVIRSAEEIEYASFAS